MRQYEDNPLAVFKRDGYIRIDYNQQLRGAVANLAEAWERFCALPLGVKQLFKYEDGAGYEMKQESGRTRDLKENFHYKPKYHDRLMAIVSGLSEQFPECASATRDLIEHAAFIMRAPGYSLFVRMAGIMEVENGLQELGGLQDEVEESFGEHVLRLLHYFGQEPGCMLAAPHADKGGFTLHFHESHPGLQYLNWDREWKDITFGGDETAIFPGMQLQYRMQGAIKALCHRVIGNEQTRSGRYSIVCFIDFGASPKYDKTNAGRSQEHEPGFNYDMPSEAFSKFFV